MSGICERHTPASITSDDVCLCGMRRSLSLCQLAGHVRGDGIGSEYLFLPTLLTVP